MADMRSSTQAAGFQQHQGSYRPDEDAASSVLVAGGIGITPIIAMADRLRRLGGRPLVLGLAAWVLVAGTAYLGTTLTT